ncbi:MAG: flagellar export protein FliJ [Clostridia bacterium]|nr:flagellar export protein FliJ [Clostridia bacterium]
MGKFNFRLEPLLKIAIHRVEEAEKNYSLCQKELTACRKQLLALCSQHTQLLRMLVESQKGKISINKLIDNHHYCQFLKAEVEKKQAEVIELENKVEQARMILLEAYKKCKILEKLKEKQYTNFLHTEEKNLQSALDELAQNSYYTSAGGF